MAGDKRDWWRNLTKKQLAMYRKRGQNLVGKLKNGKQSKNKT
jgi:hypothetical protein